MSDMMERLTELAHRQLAAEAKVEALEMDLKTAKQELIEISERTFPAIMDELNIEDFTTKDGLTIEVDRQTMGTILKENQPAAYAWLRANGHGGLIKNKVEASAKDLDELNQLIEILEGRSFRDISTIHFQTLGKWVREMLESGVSLPESIGVSEKVATKVKVAR